VPGGDPKLAEFYSGLGFKRWDVAIFTKQD
jgi:hypothetical protein